MSLYAEDENIFIPDVSSVMLRAYHRYKEVYDEYYDKTEQDYCGSVIQATIGGEWIDLQYHPCEDDAENMLACIINAYSTGRKHVRLKGYDMY